MCKGEPAEVTLRKEARKPLWIMACTYRHTVESEGLEGFRLCYVAS